MSAYPIGGVFFVPIFLCASFDVVYPELAEALSAAEGVGERAQGRRLKKVLFYSFFC